MSSFLKLLLYAPLLANAEYWPRMATRWMFEGDLIFLHFRAISRPSFAPVTLGAIFHIVYLRFGPLVGEIQSTNLLGGPPFSIKHTQDNFSLQNANRHPPKCKLERGDFCVVLYKNCRLEVANPFLEGPNLHFGGWQFTFWRLKLSWGCFIEKGGNPKRLVLGVPVTLSESLRCVFQKNPRVRKIRVRDFGAGNGCANFTDAWKNAFFLQENPCR